MKYIKALACLYLLILLSFIVQSCCERTERVTNKASVFATEVVNGRSHDITIITGEFELSVHLEKIRVAAKNFSLIGSAYATSCITTSLNHLDSASVSLTLDRVFIFRGDTIPAGISLLNFHLSPLKKRIHGSGADFTFTKRFLEDAVFPDSLYTFKFNGSTTNGIALSAGLPLNIKL